jgi:hypothetical protein
VDAASQPKPFNAIKATYTLVFFVFAAYAVALFFAEIWCAYKGTCKPEGVQHIVDGFKDLLSAALAFAAGQVTNKVVNNEVRREGHERD